MAVCVAKRHKRLWICNGHDKGVHTPPDFVKLHSREPLEVLAEQFTACGRRDIEMIARFEYRYGPKNSGSRSAEFLPNLRS
jgi:hypothetical protein